ncbi:MAG: biotin--acetyl-CoA-carboxylase ligase [Desulfovibrio sp.]|uniref:biotin--[acetyl-CoA-carboxylase] ligase n=1 Tax=Desulfovibrio sp. TaxID=885 RepID=UPI0039E5B2F1
MHMAARDMLAPWDSVQCAAQTAGRGQLRRNWYSPPGNIYVAIRLPMTPPFDGSAAAPATAYLLAEALRVLGWPVQLKWPNDIVIEDEEGQHRKLAGILLEERGGILLAGIGINVDFSPPIEVLRAGAAMEATCLRDLLKAGEGRYIPTAEALWQQLVIRMHSAYIHCHSFSGQWKKHADGLLLWRGKDVELRDDGRIVRGWLTGLGPAGGLCLNQNGRLEEFFSGSLLRTGRAAVKG